MNDAAANPATALAAVVTAPTIVIMVLPRRREQCGSPGTE